MNLNKVSNVVFNKLRSDYPEYEFLFEEHILDGRGKNLKDKISCNNFKSELVNLEVLFLREQRSVVIYFQLNLKDYKIQSRLYDLLLKQKDEISNYYPDGLLGWGSTMKRVSVFLNESGPFLDNYPCFFTSETRLEEAVLNYIELSSNVIINRIDEIYNSITTE